MIIKINNYLLMSERSVNVAGNIFSRRGIHHDDDLRWVFYGTDSQIGSEYVWNLLIATIDGNLENIKSQAIRSFKSTSIPCNNVDRIAGLLQRINEYYIVYVVWENNQPKIKLVECPQLMVLDDDVEISLYLRGVMKGLQDNGFFNGSDMWTFFTRILSKYNLRSNNKYLNWYIIEANQIPLNYITDTVEQGINEFLNETLSLTQEDFDKELNGYYLKRPESNPDDINEDKKGKRKTKNKNVTNDD